MADQRRAVHGRMHSWGKFQFQFQNLNKTLTSKSQPNISISTELKPKIFTKPSFRILTKIQLRNLNQTSAAKYWPNFSFKISTFTSCGDLTVTQLFSDFEHKVWSRFWSWSSGEILKLKFGRYFAADVWLTLRSWILVKILKLALVKILSLRMLMFGWDFEVN